MSTPPDTCQAPSFADLVRACRAAQTVTPHDVRGALAIAERLAWNESAWAMLSESQRDRLGALTEELDLYDPEPPGAELDPADMSALLRRIETFLNTVGG